ncbi:MAG TPA: type II toxin-antitoxin system RelE/ParE family toxin [Cryomorphaceae bacterium]|nr:type II toxin-antitoxin system RelE/ParE family toxin [Cryomorphaceae bacterium]
MARVDKITWTIEISKDLEGIYNFYAGKSEKAANRIIEEIISEVENLKFARQYQTDELNPNYRRIIVGHHKIVYRITQNELVVLRAFDTRSNPEKQALGS